MLPKAYVAAVSWFGLVEAHERAGDHPPILIDQSAILGRVTTLVRRV
ncbi:MAG TPA: hypothetical protein VGM21_07745 [Actinomycetota bacterium]